MCDKLVHLGENSSSSCLRSEVDRIVRPNHDCDIRRSFRNLSRRQPKVRGELQDPPPSTAPGNESDSEEEDEEEPEPEDPACGTRSGQRKKRKAEEDAELARRVKQKTEVTEILHIETLNAKRRKTLGEE